MIVLNVFLLSIILSAVFCTLSESSKFIDSRVIGGQPARAAQFPYAAAINVQTNNSRFFCGGTLYGPSWIITSGHCVYNAVLFTIQLGSNHLTSDDPNRVILATSTYVLHPEFNPDTIENDVGLIKLREPVKYTEYLTTIRLQNWVVPDNYYVYVLGWGQISDSDPELSNELQYIQLTTLSNLECKSYYGNQITEKMVCVIGNYNQGSCTGDNGSGLVTSMGKIFLIVGVSSFISSNGCESTNPSGYTRINPYYEWIQNTTQA